MICHPPVEIGNFQTGIIVAYYICFSMPVTAMGTERPIAAHKTSVCFGEHGPMDRIARSAR